LEDNISEEEHGEKINISRKRTSYFEKDCFEKSHNYSYYSTGNRTAELNLLLENPVSTKTFLRELHESSTEGRVAIAKPVITESNAQMRKRWCHDHKPEHRRPGNARQIWSDGSSFTLFPTSGRVYVLRTPKQAYNPECLVPTMKHRRFSYGLGSNIVVSC
jgi:hypothetical protein